MMPSLKPAFLNREERVSPDLTAKVCQSSSGSFGAAGCSCAAGLTCWLTSAATSDSDTSGWVSATGAAGGVVCTGAAPVSETVPCSRSREEDILFATTLLLGLIR